MMLVPTLTLRVIVSVNHLLAATITLPFTAKRRLRVLTLSAAALGTTFTRRSHGAFSRATAAATPATTPSATPATRLAIPISALATARSITATIRTLLTFYASIIRGTRQRSHRVDGTTSCFICTNGLTRLPSISSAAATGVTRPITVAIEFATIVPAAALNTISIAAATLGAIPLAAVEIVTTPIAPSGITATRIAAIPIATSLTFTAIPLRLVTARTLTARPPILITIPIAMPATTATAAARFRALTALATITTVSTTIPIATAVPPRSTISMPMSATRVLTTSIAPSITT